MKSIQNNFAGLFAIAAKGLKIFKSTKVLLAASSFATYGFLFSWNFAVVIIITLVFHEYGHLWAMKRFGMKTKGIYLIPFVGGAAVSEEAFRSRWEEVYVAAMGPTFGLSLCLVFLAAYVATGWDTLALMASYGALVNAFNLLPVSPLDGGRIMKCLAFSAHHWLGFGLFVMGIGIAVWGLYIAGIWLFGFILLISLFDYWGEWRRHQSKRSIQQLVQYQAELQNKHHQIELLLSQNQHPTQRLELEQAYEHHTKALQKVNRVLDQVPITSVATDLNQKEVVASVCWFAALGLGFFGIMIWVASHGTAGGDLPAMLLNA